MDPDANLKEQDQLVQLEQPDTHDRARLTELRRALREWIARGGFAPNWPAYPAGAASFKHWQTRSPRS
jgi:hypothetical protein